MTLTITPAERRDVQHENAARESIEYADTALAMAEREMIELGGAGDPHAEVRQSLLKVYAVARSHLDAARGALDAPLTSPRPSRSCRPAVPPRSASSPTA